MRRVLKKKNRDAVNRAGLLTNGNDCNTKMKPAAAAVAASPTPGCNIKELEKKKGPFLKVCQRMLKLLKLGILEGDSFFVHAHVGRKEQLQSHSYSGQTALLLGSQTLHNVGQIMHLRSSPIQ